MVKTLKAAGIIPLTAGGADKWPLSFFWSYLSLRQGGKAGFEAALHGPERRLSPGRISSSAGARISNSSSDLQAFRGRASSASKHLTAFGLFADGKVCDDAGDQRHLQPAARSIAADKKGLADDQIGWLDFPTVPGGKGLANRHAGRASSGGVVSKDCAPKDTVPFIETFRLSRGHAGQIGGSRLYRARRQGCGRGDHQPVPCATGRGRSWRGPPIIRISTTRFSAHPSAAP